MKCTIPGANMKVLARAIQSLSRIGVDLYVEPEVNSMSLRSVNASRSAYASFTFSKSFFASYKYEPWQSVSPSQEDSSKCKISMKSCLPIFRSPVMLDREVENCIMRFDDGGCKLIFEMKFRHGISKTYFLPVVECETLQVICTRGSTLNYLQAEVQLFLDVTHNFLNSQEEITLFTTSQETVISSYVEESKRSSKIKSTKITLDPLEFNKYTVTLDTAVSFCLKEFRAILTFAEATSQCVDAYFDTGGKPIVFGIRDPGFYEASFVLSTLNQEADVQLSTPQHMDLPNSNHNPCGIETAAASKENVASSISKEKNCQAPKNSSSSLNHVDNSPCKSEDHDKSSCGSVQNLSFLSIIRSSKSPQTSVLKQVKESQLKKRSLLFEEMKSKSTVQDEKPIHECFKTSECELNKSSRDNNTLSTSSRTSSQKGTLMDHNSMDHEVISSEIYSESSSLLLVRESDNEDGDFMLSSPQLPRKRIRLSHIFGSSINPTDVPGYDVILVGDSDDEHL